MSTREVNVKSLHLTLPNNGSPHKRRDAEALARSVAADLRTALEKDKTFAQGSVPDLRVRIERNRTSAADVTEAILAALHNAQGRS